MGSFASNVRVHDDYFDPPFDWFIATANAQGPAVNGFLPSTVQFSLISYNTALLSSDSIPTASELNAFGPDELPVSGVNWLSFGSEMVRWRVTSFVAGLCLRRRAG